MIRWLQKADGTRVLQYAGGGKLSLWQDVPTEVEKPDLTESERRYYAGMANSRPEDISEWEHRGSPKDIARDIIKQQLADLDPKAVSTVMSEIYGTIKPEPRKPREFTLYYNEGEGGYDSISLIGMAGYKAIKVREVLECPHPTKHHTSEGVFCADCGAKP